MQDKFKTVAQHKPGDAFDYESETAQAWNSFPGSKNKIHFIDTSHWRFFNPEGSSLEKAMIKIRRGSLRVARALLGDDTVRGPITIGAGSKESGSRYIFLPTTGEIKDRYLPGATEAQERACIFDHELVHAVGRGGMDDDATRSESFADAYAVIRHLQRYGAASPVINALVTTRSFQMVFREPGYGLDHFTSPIVAKILEQRHAIDWKKLTPQETVDMAQKFVMRNQLGTTTTYNLHKEFSALHDKAQDIGNGDIAPVKALAEQLTTTNSANVFKYGMLALQACMEKKNIAAALKGAEWDETRERLAAQEAVFAPPKQPPAAGRPPGSPG